MADCKLALRLGTTYVVSHECGARNLKYSRIPGQKTSYYVIIAGKLLDLRSRKLGHFHGFSRQVGGRESGVRQDVGSVTGGVWILFGEVVYIVIDDLLAWRVRII